MKLFVSSVSFLFRSLVTCPASVYGGTLRALSDEDLTEASLTLPPSMYEKDTYEWEMIGNDIDGEIGSESGDGVSLNADGSRVAVGATRGGGNSPELWGPGEVAVYERGASNNWVQLGSNIKGEKIRERFGSSVSLSGSGNRVAVGAPKNKAIVFEEGQVRVYDYINGDWVQYGQSLNGEGPAEFFGVRVRLSQDGTRLIVGGPNGNDGTGNAQVFDDIDGAWVQVGQDIYGVGKMDEAGSGVAISANGERVAVGADAHQRYTGQTRIFELEGTTWIQVGQDIDGVDKFNWSGSDVDLNYYGTRVIVGEYSASSPDSNGQARVFDEVDGTWVQVGGNIYGAKKDYNFGWSVGITDDGSRVAIAALFDEDALPDISSNVSPAAVRVFDLINNEWVQTSSDLDREVYTDTTSRVAVSADGSTVAFGSPKNEGEGVVVLDDFSLYDDDRLKTRYYGGHVRVFELVEQCYNSPLPFEYETFESIDCEDISNNQTLCEDEIVASHCPDVCNRCGTYKCLDSEATLLYQGQKGTCDILKNIDPDQASEMCSRNQIQRTCRETCSFESVGFCLNLILSPSISPSVSISPVFELCAGGESQLMIDLTTDSWHTENVWTVKDDENKIEAQNAELSSNTRTITRVCLPTSNCYTFEITDSFGDGICCSYGEGDYTITLDGVIILTGGEDFSSESFYFCV